MKKILFLVFTFSLSLFASENCKTLYTGAASYKAGDFTSAAEAWQNCVDNGFQSGDLFYNLGNAYFRKGHLGLSILNYERALRIDPANEDYLYNLKFARSLTKDKQESAEEENPVLEFLFRAHHFFSMTEQLYAIIGLVWLIVALNIFRILSRGAKAKTAFSLSVIPVAVLLGVFACSAGYKVYREKTHSEGIVIVDSADITSGPSDKAQTLNMLSEGTSVEILGIKDGWAHVRLGEKINGFAKASELGIIRLDNF